MSKARVTFNAILFFVILLNLVFYPVIWKDRTLLSSSAMPSVMPFGALNSSPDRIKSPRMDNAAISALQSEPSYAFIHQQIADEHVAPLWNPFNGFGMPLLSSFSQTFYPLTALLAFAPLVQSVDLYALVRLFFAGFFSFLYLRRFVPGAEATLGGAIFMLSGAAMLNIVNPELSAILLLPAFFWTCELLIEKRTWLRASVFGLVLTGSLLAGVPILSGMFLILSSAYALSRLTICRFKSRELVGFWTRIVIVTLVALAISAPVLLPQIEFLRNSVQPAAIHDSLALENSRQILQLLLSYFSPLIFGYSSSDNAPIKAEQLTGYFGIAASFLAVLGISSCFFKAKIVNRGTRRLRFVTLFFSVVWIASALFRFLFLATALRSTSISPWYVTMTESGCEALLAVSTAFLAAMGAYQLQVKPGIDELSWQLHLTKQTQELGQKFSFWAPAIIFIALVTWLTVSTYETVGGGAEQLQLFTEFGGILVLIFALTALGAFMASSSWHAARFGVGILLMITCLELGSAYVLPNWYRGQLLALRESDPYKGVPLSTQ